MSPAKSQAKTARRKGPPVGTAHLRKLDPALAAMIKSLGPNPLGDPRDGRPRDPYGALLRAIAGQQLSVKAASTIYARLTARFDDRSPTPEEILADDPEELKQAVGLSRAKVGYLRSLAEHVIDGELELDRLDELTDEQIIQELTAVKGLGVWTAQMFLMFQLERPDVLPTGDLGIRKAVQLAYDLPELADHDTLTRIAESWRPHRTLACRYLWASLRNEPG